MWYSLRLPLVIVDIDFFSVSFLFSSFLGHFNLMVIYTKCPAFVFAYETTPHGYFSNSSRSSANFKYCISMLTCFSVANITKTIKYNNPSFTIFSSSMQSLKVFPSSENATPLLLQKYFFLNEQFLLVIIRMKLSFPNLSRVIRQN